MKLAMLMFAIATVVSRGRERQSTWSPSKACMAFSTNRTPRFANTRVCKGNYPDVLSQLTGDRLSVDKHAMILRGCFEMPAMPGYIRSFSAAVPASGDT